MPIMSVAELQDALDHHGSDFTVWPVELRDSAATLIANSSPARRCVEAAARTERALRAAAPVKAPVDLAHRIAAAAGRQHGNGRASSGRHPK